MAKGGSLIGALEVGTAFYAAKNARSFTGFLKSFAFYAVILILIGFALTYVFDIFGFKEGVDKTLVKAKDAVVDKKPKPHSQ